MSWKDVHELALLRIYNAAFEPNYINRRAEVSETKKTVRRLYVVMENGALEKLIEASSAAQAIRLAVGERFSATPATPKDVARILTMKYALEVKS